MSISADGDATLDAPESGEVEPAEPEQLALVLVWARDEPERVGEVLLTSDEPAWFGREAGTNSDPRLRLIRQRPGSNEPAAPLDNPFLSRRHLLIQKIDEDTLSLSCHGKRRLRVGPRDFEQLTLRRGEVFELSGLYAFLCTGRPRRMDVGLVNHDFGAVDAAGIVGESPAAWELRRRTAFVAARDAHVLVTGQSGTGKELVARAIHDGSSRQRRSLVARNAATLPSGLIDAELFGNLANYPHAGMPERPGLVGQADSGTLFLDEFGELPADLQAHLLRVLDGGEYQRLGDAKPRTANLRLIAATNRDVAELKHDLVARLALRVHVPGLGERVEDVPLIARHLIQQIAQKDPSLGERYLRDWDGKNGEPRFSARLARSLVLHDYSTHVRELAGLLWRSLQSSSGGVLELTDELRSLLPEPAPRRPMGEITADELEAALARHGGVKDRVWRDLGLSSRHVLLRLMRKLGQ